LLDVGGAARYLSVAEDTIRELDARGALRRVRLPGAGDRDLKRVLFDVRDLDALVERLSRIAEVSCGSDVNCQDRRADDLVRPLGRVVSCHRVSGA
jgi:hypothetical protein